MPRPAYAPPPVRTDHTNAFANHTMRVRVPDTLQRIVDVNPDYPPAIREALLRLRDAISGDAPLPALTLPAPDYEDWMAVLAPHLGETWQATTWFVAETYAYRLILEAVRWWETGRDPFLPIKAEEEQSADLWTMTAEALAANGPDLPPDERLGRLLIGALWGNRMDLSFPWSMAHGTAAAHDDLLVDDSEAIVAHLLAARGPVHLVLDNYGRELAMDLVLADALLDSPGAESVYLHVKFHPGFVSDATAADVWRFLRLAADRPDPVRRLAARLIAAFEAGRLRLVVDPFWNGGRFCWELPERLRALLAPARLVVFKGDLNYRRLVGDAIWPAGRTFADATTGFPAPLAVLRSIKSDASVGLPAALGSLNTADESLDWSRYGLVQSHLDAASC